MPEKKKLKFALLRPRNALQAKVHGKKSGNLRSAVRLQRRHASCLASSVLKQLKPACPQWSRCMLGCWGA